MQTPFALHTVEHAPRACSVNVPSGNVETPQGPVLGGEQVVSEGTPCIWRGSGLNVPKESHIDMEALIGCAGEAWSLTWYVKVTIVPHALVVQGPSVPLAVPGTIERLVGT